MRRSLVWALAASGVLSAVALWTGKSSERLVAAVQPAVSARPRAAVASGDRSGTGSPAALQPLPATLQPVPLEPATRDFFQPVMPPPAAAPVVAAVVQAPVAPAPAPPPAMTYRYFGRMTGPDGAQTTYLTDGDKAIPINVGDVLENGYKIERIDEDGIHLVHGPTGQGALITIPSGS